MKIITWNCNMAFRKKAEYILKYKPDILVIPECEHPDKLKFPPYITQPTNILWFGKNQNKGLGIFSYGPYKFNLLDTHNPKIRTVVPIEVTGGAYDFTLYAIWAYNPQAKNAVYVEQVWKALRHYNKQLGNTPVALVGDFNSNTIWDRKHRKGNHSHVVKKLEEKGIQSSYHFHHRQQQGKESHPTFYIYRHKDKPYHLDYCFVSDDLLKKIKSVEIGDYESWIKYSDHVPVIVTFKKNRKRYA